MLRLSDVSNVWLRLCELGVQKYFDIHDPARFDAHVGHGGLSLVRRDVPWIRHWLKDLKELELVVEASRKQHCFDDGEVPTHDLLKEHDD